MTPREQWIQEGFQVGLQIGVQLVLQEIEAKGIETMLKAITLIYQGHSFTSVAHETNLSLKILQHLYADLPTA